MSKTTRNKQLEAAFAEPWGDKTKVGSLRLRPFSLGTLNVCRQLGLTLFLDGEADLDDAEKQRQIVAFAWAQSAPLPEVLGALREGTADGQDRRVRVPHGRGRSARADPGDPAHLGTGRCRRRGGDAEVWRLRRGRAPKLLEPGWTASIVFTLARETGWPEEFLVWQLPLPRALQYYHCALRASLAWTVPPSESGSNQLARLEALAARLAADGVDEEDEA